MLKRLDEITAILRLDGDRVEPYDPTQRILYVVSAYRRRCPVVVKLIVYEVYIDIGMVFAYPYDGL